MKTPTKVDNNKTLSLCLHVDRGKQTLTPHYVTETSTALWVRPVFTSCLATVIMMDAVKAVLVFPFAFGLFAYAVIDALYCMSRSRECYAPGLGTPGPNMNVWSRTLPTPKKDQLHRQISIQTSSLFSSELSNGQNNKPNKSHKLTLTEEKL